MEQGWFFWGVLPLLIMLARIVDVSIGTMRIMFVVRGDKVIAALLGFLEVFIWVVAISHIFGDNTGLLHYAAYAAGFAVGNYVGINIESRLALGLQTIRVITGQSTEALEKALLENGYGGTRIAAIGLRGGNMRVLFSTLPRRKVPAVLNLIEQHLPRSFVSIEDVRSARADHLSMSSLFQEKGRFSGFGRKGK